MPKGFVRVSSPREVTAVQNHLTLVITVMRLAALTVVVFSVMILWNVMSWLPWQVDVMIAAAASLGFAYKFERPDVQ